MSYQSARQCSTIIGATGETELWRTPDATPRRHRREEEVDNDPAIRSSDRIRAGSRLSRHHVATLSDYWEHASRRTSSSSDEAVVCAGTQSAVGTGTGRTMASRAARSPRKPTPRKSSRADSGRSPRRFEAAAIEHNRKLRHQTTPDDAATGSVAVVIRSPRFGSRVVRSDEC